MFSKNFLIHIVMVATPKEGYTFSSKCFQIQIDTDIHPYINLVPLLFSI